MLSNLLALLFLLKSLLNSLYCNKTAVTNYKHGFASEG